MARKITDEAARHRTRLDDSLEGMAMVAHSLTATYGLAKPLETLDWPRLYGLSKMLAAHVYDIQLRCGQLAELQMKKEISK